jgi:hypothetical protein
VIWANKLKGAVKTLQQFARKLIKQKEALKKRLISLSINLIIDRSWIQILNKKVIKIQKAFRGWYVRKKLIGKGGLDTIKEAGRQVKIRQNACLITRWARGFLVRLRIGKMHIAA